MIGRFAPNASRISPRDYVRPIWVSYPASAQRSFAEWLRSSSSPVAPSLSRRWAPCQNACSQILREVPFHKPPLRLWHLTFSDSSGRPTQRGKHKDSFDRRRPQSAFPSNAWRAILMKVFHAFFSLRSMLSAWSRRPWLQGPETPSLRPFGQPCYSLF
jgi:hypothetical protein